MDLTLTDDDDAPDVRLSLSPSTISENGGVSTVSATLTHPSSAATTITVRPPLDNTYTVGMDSTIVIVAGQTANTSDTVVITAVDNAQDDEPNRIVLVSGGASNDHGLASVINANLTLTDDDDPPTLSIADASVAEGATGTTASLEFIVTLSAASGRQVTVEYAETSSGRTATPGVDYTALDSGTLTFAAGVTRDTIAVSVTGDDANEPNETVVVELSNPSNATISTATGTGTITNDDAPPTLSGLALVAAKIVDPPANPSFKDGHRDYTSFSFGFSTLLPQTTSQPVTITGPASTFDNVYFHYVCADKDTRQVDPDGRAGCRQISSRTHPTSITLTQTEVDHGGVMWHVWDGEVQVTVIAEWIPIPIPDASVTLMPTFSAGTTAYTGTIAWNRNGLRVTPTASSAASTISVSLNGGGLTTVDSDSTHVLSSLSSGANTVSVTVTERSGSTPYTVTLAYGNTVPSFGSASVATQTFTPGVGILAFQVPAATSGDGALTYEATGLPAGLTFDADGSGSCTGSMARTICGTPTAGGTSSVTIYAVDADNNRTPSDRGSLSFTINVRGVTISSTTPASLTESDLDGATVTLTLQYALFSSGVSASHFELVTAIPNVSIASLGSGAGSTNSAVLTLSFSGNFNTVQTLAVRVLAAGNDANSALTSGTVTVSPSAGVTVSRSSLTLEEDPGESNANRGTYTVVLDAQPASDVVIGVNSNNTDVTLSASSLTFTNGNWNTAQTVTVTAGQDTDDADDTATVSHSVTTASGDYTTGLSIASVTVTVNDDDMLVKPTNVQVTVLVDTLSVSWGAVTSATGYKVQWKSGSENYPDADGHAATHGQATVTGTSHKIHGLTAGTTYTVRVIATRANFQDSEASDSATGVPEAPQPDAPTNVQVTALVDTLSVSWDAVTDATGYKVQWKSGSQAYNTTDRQAIVTGVSHKIPGLTGGTAYTVQVIATRTHADDSEASSEATGTPKPTLSGLALDVITIKNPPADASYKHGDTAYTTFSIGFTTLLPQTTPQPVTITGPASNEDNEYFHHVCADRDTRQVNPSGRAGCRQLSILTHPTSITLTQAEVDSGGVMWHIYDEGTSTTVMTAWISIPISESVTLTPSFASSIVNYTGSIPSITDSLHITPTASLGTATIEVGITGGDTTTVVSGGTRVFSSLSSGANTVSVTVTESSQSTTYTVTVSRGNSVPSFASTVSEKTFTADVSISAFQVPAATGGDGALTYEVTGLPTGLTFDVDGSFCTPLTPMARTICGTPTAGGTFPVTIDAIDADADRTSADRARLSFTIKVARVSISESSLALNEDPGGSNANQGTYTVVLDAQPASDVVIGVNSNNTDVTLSASSLTFTNGNWNSPQTVTVTAGSDTDGLNDTAIVSHRVTTNSGAYRTGLPIPSVAVTITDDDEPVVSIASARVDEGATGATASLEFIVTLSIASSQQVTVDYADANTGTATSGTDYTAITSGTLTIAAGVTSDTLAVSVTGDDANEPNETVVVELSNPSNATLSGGVSTLTGTGTITDDDATPTLSISSPTVTEGSGSSSLEFIVTLSAASGQQVTVGYADAGTGTATSDVDYTEITSGTLTFAAGVTRDTLAVPVTADALDEDNETVIVELSNASNATISTATGTGTITDDDATPTLSIASASVAEGTTGATPSLEFIVSLSAVSGRQVTVDYADATSGTATSGTDYTEITSGTLTIAAGVTSDTLAVSVLGDVLDEDAETVIVELSSPSNATLTGGGSTLTGTGTITDDDDPPVVSITDASVTEGDAGETPSLEFIVSLSAASGKVVTVGYADATSGTATSGTDYTAITSGTLTFAAGVTSDTLAVSVTGDDANEPDETVVVTLSSPSNATFTGGATTLTGTGTITNDDGVPRLSISSPTVAEGSGSSSLEFIVTLNAASGQQVTVDYADAGSGTATSGDDYTAITAGTLTFAAGVTSDTLAVTVLADALDEDNETVIVELSNASNAAISTATGTGTITDDDATPTLSIADASVAEGTTGDTPSLEFIVSLSAVSGRQVTVGYADATSGTATSGTDYTEITSGTLTIAAGVTSDTLAVTVRGDVLDEDDETVIVTLSSASNATLTGGGSTLTGTGIITDDDAPPVVSIDSPSVDESDDTETASLEFIVSLSAASAKVVTVGYADAGTGTATSGTDYTALDSGTLTFAAGVTRDTIAVSVTGDDANEPNETVIVTLSNPSNASFTGGGTTLTGTGTIRDDDQIDYDTDNDNLIDVTSLAQLNAIRYDLNGDGAVADSDTMNYNAAFPAAASGMGCPATCTGYELMNNLDFDSDNSGTVDANDHGGAYWNSGAGWTAIGVATSGTATVFSAIFDGNDNTISNLFINSSTSTATGGGFIGLFGDVTGTIRDVGLEDVNITNTRTGANDGRTGALAGRLSSGGTVRGSHVAAGSVTHTTSSTSTSHIGCLLGYSDGTVRDSYATCNVAGTNNYSLNIGGLIGKSDTGGTVDTTYATGTVTSTGTGIGLIAVGGLIGRNEGQISVSYATGNVSGNSRGVVGGLTGKMAGPSFANYATGNVSGSGTGTGATDVQSLNMGGLTGYIEIDSGEYLRASYATGNVSGSGTGVKAGGLIGRVMVNDANSISAVYAIGAVSSTSTGITDTGGLAGVQDGSATPMTNSYWDTQTTGQTTTAGTSSSTTGAQTTSALQSITDYTAGSIYADWNLNLDGQAGNDDPWYFGATDQYPVLKYAGLDTTAQFTLQPAIVTLALMPASISENGGVSTVTATLAHPSSAATTITVRPVAGAYTVGSDSTIAIAAGSTANASDTVVITAVDNAQDEADRNVTVSGVARNDQGVGSVTGADLTLMDDDGAPTLSISSPSVAEGDDTETASLEFIVTLSAVSGQQVTVGYEDAGSGTATSGTDYTAITAGTLTLAAGVTRDTIAVTVRGDDTIELNETVVVELSNPSNATLSGGGTTLTGTGTITDDDGSDYDTDNDNLIDITTLAQLNAIRYDLDGDGAQGSVSASDWTNYTTAFSNAATGMGCPATCTGYELMNNLDFDSNGSGSVDAGDDYPNWTAIGVDASGAATVFSAIFDGNDNTISNLSINSSTSTATGGGFVGLFGDVSGTIRDVGLLDVNITNTRTGSGFGRTGALASRLISGGAVRGSYVAGGSVTHTTSSSSSGWVGCLLGYSEGTVSDSYATCNATGANNGTLSIGGLIGETRGAVDSTYATGTVTITGTGSVAAGGLIGWTFSRVSVSYATGNVTGSGLGRVGGLTGGMGGSSYANYATGNVSGSGTGTGATTNQSLRIGGLVGDINLGEGEYLRASYATGKVSGSGTGVKAGGLTGRVRVHITNANSITAVYAIGAVSNTSTGTTATGGLAGEQGGTATPMNNSYWDTQTTGQTTTAGTSSSTTGAQTTSALQSITGYTVGSIYANWNLNLDGQAGNDDPWNFGATNQYPVLKYAGLDATAQFTLQPAIVTLALMPASISENGGVSTVTATLAYPSSAATTITVRPVAGAYAVGADSTIAIAAGQTANASDTVVITAVDNAQDELDRSVTVSGVARNDQGVGSVTGVGLTLTDDDAAPTVTMAVAPASISENGAISTVMATLSHPSSAATTITVSVTPVQPAVAGDYTLSTADTLIVAAGQTTSTGTVTITTVDNAVTSGNKTVTVSSTVGNSVGAGTVTDATLTIIDDEAAQVTLVLSPSSISENAEVSTITATLDRTVAVATTITVSAEAVSPAEANDFTLSGATTLTIAANVATSTGTVTITAVNNTTDAPDKRVTVAATVAGGDGASLSSAVTLTITDDDEAPDVTLVLTPSSISENAEVSTVSATLSHPSSAITTITVSAEAVSPATASDFTLSSADTLIIAASETTSTGTVTITAVNNDARADEKTVTVSATANNTQGINDPSDVTLTITDDETPSANLDVDGDGRVDLFTDVIMLIRYALSFREESLTYRALSVGATRTTHRDITDYIVTLYEQKILDVDGDGEVDLFTDIIMIIRYALSFREESLTYRALSVGATRTTHQDITAYILSLHPDSHFQ